MRIKNLTGSPYELTDKDGNKIMLPAFGIVEIEPHPMHVNQYKQLGYFDIDDRAAPEEKKTKRKQKEA